MQNELCVCFFSCVLPQKRRAHIPFSALFVSSACVVLLSEQKRRRREEERCSKDDRKKKRERLRAFERRRLARGVLCSHDHHARRSKRERERKSRVKTENFVLRLPFKEKEHYSILNDG